MTDRLKVGVVGAGLIAQVMHLNYLRELSDRFEIIALCDISGENAVNNAARYNIGKTFTDWREMLDDADIDVTYGQQDGGFGPDEVGSYSARSPFGLVDITGNVWEITRALKPTDYVIRGGSFYNDALTSSVENRNFVPSKFKHLLVGMRVCADAP